MRHALEEDVPSGVSANTVLEAASWWFIHSAGKLWVNVAESREFEGQRAIGGGKHESKGWTGYSAERWAVWKQGLRDALTTTENEDTKKLIQDALTEIERVTPKE